MLFILIVKGFLIRENFAIPGYRNCWTERRAC